MAKQEKSRKNIAWENRAKRKKTHGKTQKNLGNREKT